MQHISVENGHPVQRLLSKARAILGDSSTKTTPLDDETSGSELPRLETLHDHLKEYTELKDKLATLERQNQDLSRKNGQLKHDNTNSENRLNRHFVKAKNETKSGLDNAEALELQLKGYKDETDRLNAETDILKAQVSALEQRAITAERKVSTAVDNRNALASILRQRIEAIHSCWDTITRLRVDVFHWQDMAQGLNVQGQNAHNTAERQENIIGMQTFLRTLREQDQNILNWINRLADAFFLEQHGFPACFDTAGPAPHSDLPSHTAVQVPPAWNLHTPPTSNHDAINPQEATWQRDLDETNGEYT